MELQEQYRDRLIKDERRTAEAEPKTA
jgi:hypothetical protein